MTGARRCGHFGWRRVRAVIALPAGPVEVRREYLLAAELPYAFVRTRVRYPATPGGSTARRLAAPAGQDLGRPVAGSDALRDPPLPSATAGSPFRVWKRNWLDSVTSYDFDYGCVLAERHGRLGQQPPHGRLGRRSATGAAACSSARRAPGGRRPPSARSASGARDPGRSVIAESLRDLPGTAALLPDPGHGARQVSWRS